MKKIRKPNISSMKSMQLCITVFITMGVMRGIILCFPFKNYSKLLGKKMVESNTDLTPRELAIAQSISWAIEKMGMKTPWESKCLVRAMTAQRILRWYKIPSTLYLGVGKRNPGEIGAHAWLRCGHLIVTGEMERQQYTPVAHFAYMGRRRKRDHA